MIMQHFGDKKCKIACFFIIIIIIIIMLLLLLFGGGGVISNENVQNIFILEKNNKKLNLR